jgi:hypothetical protein
LDLQSPPAVDESYTYFSGDFDPSQPGPRSTANFTTITVPLQVGGTHATDDGVVGYFLEQNGTVSYAVFYSPFASDGTGPVARAGPQTLLLTVDPKAPDLRLTLIIDPRAKVYATTPILPQGVLELPAMHYASTLSGLKVAFFTTPILSDAKTLAVPVPVMGGGKWSWIDGTTNGPWPETTTLATVTEQALLTGTAQELREGWLALKMSPQEAVRRGRKERA